MKFAQIGDIAQDLYFGISHIILLKRRDVEEFIETDFSLSFPHAFYVAGITSNFHYGIFRAFQISERKGSS